jgi:polyisoprenoid-binding protein YceI
MNRALAAALFAICAATPALAAHWNVDYAKSNLGFAVQWSGEPFIASFKSWKADIDFDPNDLAHSHVSVAIDLGSETSDSPDNDDGIKGAQGFQVSQFPGARFETTGFEHGNGSDYIADGKLTIHGVTRTIAMPFQLLLSSDTAHMKGRAEVMRTDFGLGQGGWASEKPVGHRVIIFVDLVAKKVH